MSLETDGRSRIPQQAHAATRQPVPELFAGRLVRLRSIEVDDWEAFREGDRDTEVMRLGYEIFPRRAEAGQRAWTEARATEDYQDDRFYAIEALDGGTLLGSTSARGCNPQNGTFEYGIALFRPYWRRGYGSDAVKVLLRYYFGERRYQKVNTGVYEFNEASLAMHERLGFRREGCRRRNVYTAGRYWDEVLFGMTAEEFAEQHPDFAPRLEGAGAEGLT